MAPKKPARKPVKASAAKAKPAPLPPMPATGKGQCGVDGYCCQGKSPEDCCGGNCGGNCGCKESIWSCHILAMMKKRAFWLGSIVSIVTIGLFQWLWHGPVMMDRYIQTAYLWRPMEEIAANGHLFIMHHVLYGVVFTLLFLMMGGYSWLKGIKNGILIASPLAICMLVVQATQPIPMDILRLWAAGDLLQGAILGLVLACVTNSRLCSTAGCGGKGCC